MERLTYEVVFKKKLNELSARELFTIYYYRVATFIVAQKRIYQGVDKTDLKAYHLYSVDDNGNLVTYARFFPNGMSVSFGRVLVLPQRGKGLGKKLMIHLLNDIHNHLLNDIHKIYGNKTITIYSQYDKRSFYHKFGFKIVDKPFIYMHTKHVKMIKNKN